MAQENSKQKLANLIQRYEQNIEVCRSLYDDTILQDWAVQQSLRCKEKLREAKDKLNQTFSIDEEQIIEYVESFKFEY